MLVKMVGHAGARRAHRADRDQRDERHEQRVLEQVLSFFVAHTDFTRFSSIDMKSSPEESAPPVLRCELAAAPHVG